jgi:hypothetical protein
LWEEKKTWGILKIIKGEKGSKNALVYVPDGNTQLAIIVALEVYKR